MHTVATNHSLAVCVLGQPALWLDGRIYKNEEARQLADILFRANNPNNWTLNLKGLVHLSVLGILDGKCLEEIKVMAKGKCKELGIDLLSSSHDELTSELYSKLTAKKFTEEEGELFWQLVEQTIESLALKEYKRNMRDWNFELATRICYSMIVRKIKWIARIDDEQLYNWQERLLLAKEGIANLLYKVLSHQWDHNNLILLCLDMSNIRAKQDPRRATSWKYYNPTEKDKLTHWSYRLQSLIHDLKLDNI